MCKEETRTKNLLVIPISTFNFNKIISDDEFKCPEGYAFKSITTSGYQMEPIPKFLNKILPNGLDSILVINTPETKDERVTLTIKQKDKESKLECTAYEYFCDCVEMFSKEGNNTSKISVDQVCIANNDFATQKDLESIVEEIKKYAEDKNYNIRIFFDIHGGPRSNAEMMSALFSLLPLENISSEILRESPVRIEPQDVFSTVWKGNHNPDNKIYVANSGYEMLDLVSGVHEFVQYGKAESLEKYAEKNEDIKKLVSAMKEISNGLSMGHVKTFDNGVKKLQEELGITYIQHLGKSGFLARLIEQEYEMILNDADVTKQILWNNSKQFYQFAMTLCESKMLGYSEEKGILDFDAMTVAERKNITKAENQLKMSLKKTSLSKKGLKKVNDAVFRAKNQYDQKLNAFIRNFERIEINHLDILYYVENNNMYFFCSNGNEISKKLSLFLSEHGRIKETRNNSNHAGDNNPDAYQNVIELREAIEKYISYFDFLNEHHAHYKIHKLDTSLNYGCFCKENGENLIDEGTFKQLKKITLDISNNTTTEEIENPKIKLNLGIDFEQIENFALDYDNQIARVKCYLNNYQILKLNNQVILYYKPNKESEKVFRHGDDHVKCFFLCFKNEYFNEVNDMITNAEKLLNLNKGQLESANVQASKNTELKIYSITSKLTYKKFCNRFKETIIDEKTYLLLRQTVFKKINTNGKSESEEAKKVVDMEEARQNLMKRFPKKR